MLGDAHQVVCAAKVEDAVDHLLVDAIDLVLLIACFQTDRTGRSLSKPTGRTSPIVFMTGDPGHAKELVGGARPYLLKPFRLASLHRCHRQQRPAKISGY